MPYFVFCVRRLISLHVRRWAALAILFLLLMPMRIAKADIQELISLTVLAPPSFTEAMTELARHYSKRGRISIVVSYVNAAEQFESVSSGEPADIIITDDAGLMRQLKQKGVLDVYSQAALAYDQLVVMRRSLPGIMFEELPDIAARAQRGRHLEALDVTNPYKVDQQLPWRDASPMPVREEDTEEGFSDQLLAITSEAHRLYRIERFAQVRELLLMRPLYLADRGTALGNISRELMDALYLPVGRGIEYRADSRQLLATLEEEGGVAVLYYSDLQNHGVLDMVDKAALDVIPVASEGLYTAPVFWAGVVAGEYMEEARYFMQFLKSPEARAILDKYHLREKP